MSQPSILDSGHGFPQSSFLFPARASPIVCFTETFQILLSLLSAICNGTDLRTSCARVSLQRHQARHLGSRTLHMESLQKSAIRQHPKASTVIFLGTLTQAIKIFGFQGVMWAQVIAAIYLLSYLISVSMQVLGQNGEAEATYSPISSRKINWLRGWDSRILKYSAGIPSILSLFISFLVCAWAIFHVCDSSKQRFQLKGPLNTPTMPSGVFFSASLFVGMCIRMFCLFGCIFAALGLLAVCASRLKTAVLGNRYDHTFGSVMLTFFLMVMLSGSGIFFGLNVACSSWFLGNRGIFWPCCGRCWGSRSGPGFALVYQNNSTFTV